MSIDSPGSYYSDPDYYSMLFDERGDDVRFYLGLCASGSRDGAPSDVLEYGVGAGRVAIPLARAGHTVVGVDPASAMLGLLATRAAREPSEVRARLSWRCADARELALGRVFPRVIAPFNVLAHNLTRAELRAFLQRVHDHLAPGGLFVFDVWLPDPRVLLGTTVASPRFRHPASGETLRCTESYQYDHFTQVLTTAVTLTPADGAPPRRLVMTQRQLFPEETMLLLDLHGFRVRWRTSRYAPMADRPTDGIPVEPEDARGELLAYVCERA